MTGYLFDLRYCNRSLLAEGDMMLNIEAVTRSYSVKKVLLKVYQSSQENTCVRVSCFTKVAVLRPVIY